MPACFGLYECASPPIPAGRLAEDHRVVDVWGHGKGHGGSHPAAQPSEISRINSEVELTWDEDLPGVRRPFWVCPKCGRKCRYIYVPQTACRQCCGLDWSSRHCNRTVPGYNRLVNLRRKLGADPAPFTDLPLLPPRATRKRRLAAEIGVLEARLLGHLSRDVCDVLERRLKLRGLK